MFLNGVSPQVDSSFEVMSDLESYHQDSNMAATISHGMGKAPLLEINDFSRHNTLSERTLKFTEIGSK